MAEIFKVQIITPDRIFYEGEADFLEFTTLAGEIGVYAKHIPMTTVLAPGAVIIHKGDEEVVAAVHAGFAEVLGDQVTLMAEIAEWPNEIDVNRAEAARNRAASCFGLRFEQSFGRPVPRRQNHRSDHRKGSGSQRIGRLARIVPSFAPRRSAHRRIG